MRIQLDKHYQDVSGVKLSPGEQDVPNSLGQYLIEHGHAVAVDEVEWSSEALPKSIDIEDVVATVEAADIEYKQEIEALRAEYESLTGESPDGRWGAERLQSEIDSMVIDD